MVGLPRPQFNARYKIVQFPGQVVLLYESYQLWRVIPLDGRPRIGPDIKLWMGESRGRWEGNTLVVEVTNLNGKPRIDMIGNFMSDAVRITERFNFIDANTLHYEATIDDPTVFTRPWKLVIPSRRSKVPADYEIYEAACHEGERTAETLLLKP
jgi:hypothetical protein